MRIAIRRWIGPGVTALGIVLGALPATAAGWQPASPRTVYAHLNEWSWDAVARECTQFLGPRGYAAVLVSPPQEHAAGDTRSARYRPLSYRLQSRGGDRDRFKAMVGQCKAAGVEVHVEAVINHMAAGSDVYGADAFHTPACDVTAADEADPAARERVTRCRRSGQPDLDTGKAAVQQKIAAYLQDLLDLGVTGFRIDSAKYIPPADLGAIKARLSGDPVFIHDIAHDAGVEAELPAYGALGPVTESRYAAALKNAFLKRGGSDLSTLKEGIGADGWQAAANAVVHVGTPADTRADCGTAACPGPSRLDGERLRLAQIFMLAHDYGYAGIASDYYFSTADEGPGAQPYTGDETAPARCSAEPQPGRWDCAHRDPRIANMVGFRALTHGAPVGNWTAGTADQIAFSRGNRGFVAINNADDSWQRTFATGLPDGVYCNILAAATPNDCPAGAQVKVSGGQATLTLPPLSAVALQPSVAPALPEPGDRCGPFQPTVILPHPVTVSELSTTSVKLAWEPIRLCDPVAQVVREASYYEIYRNGVRIQPHQDGTVFTDAALQPASRYTYSIVGVAGAFKSIYRGDVTVNTPWPVCGAPRPLRAGEVSKNSIQLIWDPVYFCHPILTVVNPADRYDVYRNGVKIGSTQAPRFTDTGLFPGHHYDYTFVAVDRAGNRGPQHPVVNLATLNGVCTPPPPQPPIRIVVGAVTSRSVTLSWPPMSYCDPERDVVVEAVAYEISRNGQVIGRTSATSYTDTGLAPASPYSYTVVGIDREGRRLPPNPVVSVRTEPELCVMPAVMPQLFVTRLTSSSVELGWMPWGFCDPRDGSSRMPVAYEVYRDGVLIGKTETLRYTDAGLKPSTTYRYTLVGIDQDGVRGPRYPVLAVNTPAGKTITVYYKRGFAEACFHFAPENGTWTALPGLRMQPSDVAGYSRITVDSGTAAWIQVAFNDCMGRWDSNYGANYRFGPGTWTYDAGRISAGAPVPVEVGFSVNASVSAGQKLYLVGNIAALSGWNTAAALPLTQAGPVWSTRITLPPGTAVEYKYIKKDAAGAVVWESGANRGFTTPTTGSVSRSESWK